MMQAFIQYECFVCVCVCDTCRELLHTTAAQELEWSRGWDVRGGQRARAQTLGSSVGEDRAMLLGFTMMAFSVLMFFLVGVTTVKPYVSRLDRILMGYNVTETLVKSETGLSLPASGQSQRGCRRTMTASAAAPHKSPPYFSANGHKRSRRENEF